MKQIWKFSLQATDSQVIQMPKGAKVLCAGEQAQNIYLWAEVNPSAPTEGRTFEVFGTGHPMDESSREYIGTVMLLGGSLVFHVYESK